MQTIRIIIVKRKLNYVKNEVTMTDYDSRQSRSRSNTSANLLFYRLRAVLFFLLSSSSRDVFPRLDKLKSKNSDCSQSSYFKTVSPKPVPLNRAISPEHNNVLFQRGQCGSTKTARSKVCKLLFNPGSSMVQ